MQLTDSQAQQIKSQLIEQINSTFPKDKKNSAIQQIQKMDNLQLFEFLQQNNLIKDLPDKEISEKISNQMQNSECIFCSIINEQIHSYKIKENSKAKAFLEINPLSKAHTIIIPIKHIKTEAELPQEALDLAKEVSIKIKKELSPKDIKISSRNMFEHQIIDVIPIYDLEKSNTEQYKAEKSELEFMQKILTQKDNSNNQKTESKKNNKEILKNIKLPKRIP